MTILFVIVLLVIGFVGIPANLSWRPRRDSTPRNFVGGLWNFAMRIL